MSFPRLQHDDTEIWLDIGLNSGAEGGALYTAGTADSTARTQIGDPDVDTQRVAFAGVHGSFHADHGVRGRQIVWSGNIRCSTAALATIRTQRDTLRIATGTFTFTNDDDSEYAECVLESYDIGERRRITGNDSLDWMLPYRIVLFQLEV